MLLNVMFAPSQETQRRFQAQNQGGTRSVFLTYAEKVSNRQIDLMSLKLHVPLPCEGSVSSVTQWWVLCSCTSEPRAAGRGDQSHFPVPKMPPR